MSASGEEKIKLALARVSSEASKPVPTLPSLPSEERIMALTPFALKFCTWSAIKATNGATLLQLCSSSEHYTNLNFITKGKA